MSTLLTGISELRTVSELGTIKNAALLISNGVIEWVGWASDAPTADETVDLGGRAVLPGWVDSHTHMVFDGNRAEEFEARMAGQSYAAGGIAVTMEATRSAGTQRLHQLVAERVAAGRAGGTTTFETKTGYGLNVESEAEAARVASEHVDEVTFLGAHLVPPGADAEEYVNEVVGPMLDAVKEHVQWIDVFCERGAFNEEQSRRVLEAGTNAGLGVRVHGNQLGEGPGVRLAVEMGAASVDHVNYLSDTDIELLAKSDTVATLLPACDLSTRESLAPGRELIDAGATVAIASNLNPGTSFTSSMNFCVTTAVLQQRLTLDEAIAAATTGGATALRRHNVGAGKDPQGRPAKGTLVPGAAADLHVLDAANAINLAYRPGMPITWQTWVAGEKVYG
ncbi:Imidazolonepropionase [Corynebacterium capitovis DSM 44611]|uniref:imidazolonepropionase n=1 Tax=Corynebacterium capitovis TaxID=131081 RepID=UPI00036E28A8|nr:imidazolonepropionase [Corynebacterium capitovis]WKD58313.1 Imidazolonepropionase [Corynebacterium capitovis DSM 44611]